MVDVATATPKNDALPEPEAARFSLLNLSAAERLIGAAAVSGLLWLGVVWALAR
jgi:hypothetical protein